NLGLTETVNKANHAVPSSRRVNGKALTGDISLTAGDVGAFSLGLTGRANAVPWNTDTGLYELLYPGYSEHVAHFYNGSGSCPAFQLKVGNRNSGIAYRSARDSYGFEEDWTNIYTTKNKPSAEDVGAVSATGGDYNSQFRFKQVGTIPNERNAVMLVSRPGPTDSGTQISYTRYGWYDNEVKTGIVRGGSTDMLGYVVDINSKRVLTVSPGGDVLPSGYILSRAVNYFDDPNSRNLSRSGFLRPNGLDNLGDLAIHVAHPQGSGPEYSRGISFDYGGNFGIYTYSFNKDGKFAGSKRILTENDANSLENIPVGSPIPWPQPNPPSGYLACNGQAFNKSLYPKLAAAYPSGTIPDLRGEFIRGWDDGRGVDSGRGILSWQADEFKSHTHTSSLYDAGSAAEYFGRSNWKLNGSVETGATGGNETRPRNIAFNYIVRAA
ncbi:phage-related tail fiber protein, partial [Photorhabdus temperata subsp. temperata Meg1]